MFENPKAMKCEKWLQYAFKLMQISFIRTLRNILIHLNVNAWLGGKSEERLPYVVIYFRNDLNLKYPLLTYVDTAYGCKDTQLLWTVSAFKVLLSRVTIEPLELSLWWIAEVYWSMTDNAGNCNDRQTDANIEMVMHMAQIIDWEVHQN